MSAPNPTPQQAVKVLLGCSRCGATLPDDAQFCLKCGKPVSSQPLEAKDTPAVEVLPAAPVKPRKRRLGLWISLLILLAAIIWSATSENPFAQAVQEFVGWKHDQSVLETDTPFSVAARNFRYYKFSLPEGSVNVAIVGQFTVASDHSKADVKSNDRKGNKAEDSDSNIEVYVLSEPAFTVWQNGYGASAVYESGRVPQGTVQAELPAGAGIYYLVFSNRFSTKAPKNVNATVLLRYKSWLPDWFRRIKQTVWNWIGL